LRHQATYKHDCAAWPKHMFSYLPLDLSLFLILDELLNSPNWSCCIYHSFIVTLKFYK
jgi:hypothetical protein